MLKVLWCSDAAWAPSGYGIETKLVAPRLAKLCDLALLTTYGLHGARMTWNPDTNELQQGGGSGVPVYPGGADPFANDAIGQSARDWKADIIITLKDSFVFRPEAFQGFRWMPMVPVDHEPIPPSVVQVCRHAYRPIAYAPNGFRELRAAGFDPCFAPHAYDPNIFYPMPRAEARKLLGLPDDIFIVGTVAVNRGGIPSRKAWPQNLEAFAQFRRHHEDAFYLIHTNVADDGYESGIPLRPYAAQLGILDRLIAPEPERYKAGFPDDYMRALYNSLDVLNAVSLGEGFGIPQLEAQACFPAETPVIAKDVVNVMKRRFTGELIQIHTKRGMIEATPEHPFWTNNGWVRAIDLTCECLLLYNNIHEEGQHNTYAGRMGDVNASLSDYDAQRSRASDGQKSLVTRVASTTTWASEAFASIQADASRTTYLNTNSVHCGSYRRRRYHIDPQACREVEALYPNSQYAESLDGLARADNSGAIDIYRTPRASHQADDVYVSSRGISSLASLRVNRTTPRDQAPLDANGDRVLQNSPRSVSQRALDTPPRRDRRGDQTDQYEPIFRIDRRQVTNLPVYNFTTLSGTYHAGGYLVHNCGVPVITSDFAAARDLCFAGWKVSDARGDCLKFYDGQASHVFLPEPAAVAERLSDAYRAIHAGRAPSLRAQALAGAAPYQIDRVVAEYWKPLLEEVERDIRSETSRGVLRIVRREEVFA